MTELFLGLLCPCLVTFRPLIRSGYVELSSDCAKKSNDASVGTIDAIKRLLPSRASKAQDPSPHHEPSENEEANADQFV